MNYRVKNVLVGCLIALATTAIVAMFLSAYIGQKKSEIECLHRGGDPVSVGRTGKLLCLKPDSVIYVPGDVHG